MLSIWEDFGGKSDGGKRRKQRVGVLVGNRVRGIILLFSAMWGRVGRIWRDLGEFLGGVEYKCVVCSV